MSVKSLIILDEFSEFINIMNIFICPKMWSWRKNKNSIIVKLNLCFALNLKEKKINQNVY